MMGFRNNHVDVEFVRADPKTGGNAFPQQLGRGFARGMSLRDWFAGQALASLISADPYGACPKHARAAYAMADAMLEEKLKA